MQPSSCKAGLPTVVLIAAYQAQPTIASLVKAVVAMGLPVCVVDDASTDATAQLAQKAGAYVLVRSVNGGKGTCVRQGLEWIRQRMGPVWVLMLDADGQHLPEEIPRFLEAGKEGGADVVIGNRMDCPKGMPLDRRWTNRFMSWLLSHLIRQRVPDTQCGFRLISPKVVEKIRLSSQRFEIESELVLKAGWAGFRIRSIPIASVYRGGASFIRPVRDTWRFLLFLWRMHWQKMFGRL